MALKFGNPIVAGTVLVIPAIQSPNFEAGVRGWRIGADGTLEAHSVSIPTTITGATLIMDGTSGQSLAYSGAPALGNLIAATSGADGSDSEGNPYRAGTAVYSTSIGGVEYVLAMQSGAGLCQLFWGYWSGTAWVTEAVVTFTAGQFTIDTSGAAGGSIVLNAGTSTISLDSPTSVGGPLTATQGTAASPTLITTDTWHPITLDAEWTAGAQVPQYRLLPDGNVQVRGQASIAGTTAAVNINNGNPIPAAYRPGQTRYYRPPDSGDAAGTVQISGTGVFAMRASGFTATQALMDGVYSI